MPQKSLWARLPFSVRMTTAGLGILALIAGGAGGIAALTAEDPAATGAPAALVEVPPQPSPATPTDAGIPAGEAANDRAMRKEADRSATRRPRRTEPVTSGGNVARAAAGEPVVRTERVSETQTIPFRTRLVRDPSMRRGSTRIRTTGQPGERVLHYLVTYTHGRETSRRLLNSTVKREPRHRVIAYGSRRESSQDWREDDQREDDQRAEDRADRDGDRDWDRPSGRAALCSDTAGPELLTSDRFDAEQ